MEFLKNPKTGVVLVATAILLKRKDLVPCDVDGKTNKDRFATIVLGEEPVSPAIGNLVQADPPLIDTGLPDPPPVVDPVEAKKEAAAEFIQKTFGRDVSKVTRTDIAAHAKDAYGDDLAMDTKLNMTLAVMDLAAQQEG